MCDMFSALVMKNGDLVFYPEVTDSHEDLVHLKNVNDSYLDPAFLRIEYSPDMYKGNWADINSYVLLHTAYEIPEWWTDELRDRTIERLRDRISRLIVHENRDVILGGACILAKDVHVERIVGSRILYADQGSLVAVARNCRIVKAGQGRFKSVTFSQIDRGNSASFGEVVNCHIDRADRATFDWIHSSSVTHGSDSKILDLSNSTINHCNSCTIDSASMSVITSGGTSHINIADDVIIYQRHNMIIDKERNVTICRKNQE